MLYLEPDAERRASQIRVSDDPYKLEIQARPGLPVLDVYAQAPSVGDAESLAEAAVPATNSYLAALARHDGFVGAAPVRLGEIGSPRAGPLDPTAPMTIAFLTFVVAFSATFGLLFALAQVRRGWLRAGQRRATPPPPSRPPTRRADDWPHTTRVLPWMIAGFIAMLWLLPINAITVQASLPVDLKLDRLVLPVIVLTWLLSLAAEGREPRAGASPRSTAPSPPSSPSPSSASSSTPPTSTSCSSSAWRSKS